MTKPHHGYLLAFEILFRILHVHRILARISYFESIFCMLHFYGMKRAYERLFFLGAAILAIILLAFYAADHVANSAAAQDLVEQFGILGIFVIAFISGLNLVVPIHAAAFTPIFSAAGFGLPTIVAVLVVGTTAADLLSYALGRWGRRTEGAHMDAIKVKIDAFAKRHRRFILPGIFFYAALVPFPNEAILIPLGLMGFRFIFIITPLILGTLLNQTLFALGFSSAFDLLF